jgi:hypothetical protein
MSGNCTMAWEENVSNAVKRKWGQSACSSPRQPPCPNSVTLLTSIRLLRLGRNCRILPSRVPPFGRFQTGIIIDLNHNTCLTGTIAVSTPFLVSLCAR